MLDVLFILAIIIFFVVAILYVYGCNRLIRDDELKGSSKLGDRIETMGERKVQNDSLI